MRYLCLLAKRPDVVPPEPGTAEAVQVLQEWQAANEAMAEAGVLVELGRLSPPSSATTVRSEGTEPLLTDGPFAELKEEICGFYVIDCADLDEALKWAQTIPLVRAGGSVEVRPMMARDGR